MLNFPVAPVGFSTSIAIISASGTCTIWKDSDNESSTSSVNSSRCSLWSEKELLHVSSLCLNSRDTANLHVNSTLNQCAIISSQSPRDDRAQSLLLKQIGALVQPRPIKKSPLRRLASNLIPSRSLFRKNK